MEDIFVALNSILSHKMRSMLTMLGIIIGIGAIIAIFSIIEGNTENTKRQLIGGSNNTIKVVYDKKNVIDPSIPEKAQAKKPGYIPFMGEDILNKIRIVHYHLCWLFRKFLPNIIYLLSKNHACFLLQKY